MSETTMPSDPRADLGTPATFEVAAAGLDARELRPGGSIALAADAARLYWLPDAPR